MEKTQTKSTGRHSNVKIEISDADFHLDFSELEPRHYQIFATILASIYNTNLFTVIASELKRHFVSNDDIDGFNMIMSVVLLAVEEFQEEPLISPMQVLDNGRQV